ncbi:hypothetical protein AOLI_G00307000 [Acnodon oligacanthus]
MVLPTPTPALHTALSRLESSHGHETPPLMACCQAAARGPFLMARAAFSERLRTRRRAGTRSAAGLIGFAPPSAASTPHQAAPGQAERRLSCGEFGMKALLRLHSQSSVTGASGGNKLYREQTTQEASLTRRLKKLHLADSSTEQASSQGLVGLSTGDGLL